MSNQLENKENKHLFRASYLISNHLIGGVSFTIELIIDSKTNKVIGIGHIFQSVSPPMNVVSQLEGDYSYMCTMKSCDILVVADGVSSFHPLIHGVPQNYKNVSLRMSLNEDWKSGTATYKFLYNGEWVDSGYQRVDLIESSQLPSLDQLAALEINQQQRVS